MIIYTLYIIVSQYRVINSRIEIRIKSQRIYCAIYNVDINYYCIVKKNVFSFVELNYIFIEAERSRKQGDWTAAKANYENCGKLAREYFQSCTTFYSSIIITAALH